MEARNTVLLLLSDVRPDPGQPRKSKPVEYIQELSGAIKNLRHNGIERSRSYEKTSQSLLKSGQFSGSITEGLPDLNTAGDAKLTELQGRIKEELSMFSTADLRDSDKVRELTAKAALEIANAMEEEQPMLRAIVLK